MIRAFRTLTRFSTICLLLVALISLLGLVAFGGGETTGSGPMRWSSGRRPRKQLATEPTTTVAAVAMAKAKELDSFKVFPKNTANSSAARYEIDYNDNLIRLIENFLLRHMKKLIENQMRNKPAPPPLSASSGPLSPAELNEIDRAKIQAFEYNRLYPTTTPPLPTPPTTKSTTTRRPFTTTTRLRTRPSRKRKRTTTRRSLPVTSFDWYDPVGGGWATETAIYQLISSPPASTSSTTTSTPAEPAAYDCEFNVLTGRNFTCRPRTSTSMPARLSSGLNISFNYSETLIPWNESNVFDLVIPSGGNETTDARGEPAESEYAVYYKNYFVYFVSLIIFLATLCLIFLVIIFISCVINCKQRSRLSYFNENEFFTYYNKNVPVIASVSSFSLTTPLKKKCSFNTNNYENATDVASKASNSNEPLVASATGADQTTGAEPTLTSTGGAAAADHKLSTHLFGNKSSLTLYNQSAQEPAPAHLPPLPGSSKLFHSTSTVHYPGGGRQNGPAVDRSSSFRIMNKCQPKFMNLDGLHSASSMPASGRPVKEDLITTLSKNLIEASKNSEIKHLCRQLSNENLHNQHLNFIAGIRSADPLPPSKMSLLSANNSINRTLMQQRKQQQQQQHSDVYQSYPMVTPNRLEDDDDDDDDDEDIILENDINDALGHAYPSTLMGLPAAQSFRLGAYNRSSTLKDDELAGVQVIDAISNNRINLTKSQSTYKTGGGKPTKLTKSPSKQQNSFNLGRLNPLAGVKAGKSSSGGEKAPEVRLKSAKMLGEDDGVRGDGGQVNPSFIRERYYQLLREQIFPFLQRPGYAAGASSGGGGSGSSYPLSYPSGGLYNHAGFSSSVQALKESQQTTYTNDVLY